MRFSLKCLCMYTMVVCIEYNQASADGVGVNQIHCTTTGAYVASVGFPSNTLEYMTGLNSKSTYLLNVVPAATDQPLNLPAFLYYGSNSAATNYVNYVGYCTTLFTGFTFTQLTKNPKAYNIQINLSSGKKPFLTIGPAGPAGSNTTDKILIPSSANFPAPTDGWVILQNTADTFAAENGLFHICLSDMLNDGGSLIAYCIQDSYTSKPAYFQFSVHTTY